MSLGKSEQILCCLVLYHIISISAVLGPSDQPEAYFNGTSYIRLDSVISLKHLTGFSFRTCAPGELFSQKHNDNKIELSVTTEGLRFTVKMANKQFEESIVGNYIDNAWHTVLFTYSLGNLTLSIDDASKLIANASYRKDILTNRGLYDDGSVLILGNHFTGCMLEGPSLVFNHTNIHPINVLFGHCPVPFDSCTPILDVNQMPDFCLNEPCMRHGTCQNGPTTYTCLCAPRYTGKNCEIDNGNTCQKRNPCKNGATCVDDHTGNYVCNCLMGFTGKLCEHEIKVNPLCHPNPCHNGGTCKVQPDSNKSECSCPPGFVGSKCETNVNECMSLPCRNGGRCIDGPNNYTCDCTHSGYTGLNCEKDIDECLNNPCLNHGTCFNTYGSYICQCPSGFEGLHCQLNVNDCMSQPCLNNGRCENRIGGYECFCQAGFSGTYCEKRGVQCDVNTCPPYADCKEIGGIATCVCKIEFPGVFPNCSTNSPCLNNPCKNGGTCITTAGAPECICPPGFTDLACRSSICKVPFACWCAEGFAGDTCEHVIKCNDDPCSHALSCQDFPGGFYCRCEMGWMGLRCDINIDDCLSTPCLNGATCIDMMHNYKCHCARGFTGERCHIDIDECVSMPCYNGGICIDKPNGYICNCTDQWNGPLCEKPYNACDMKPCQNNGTCNVGPNRRDYTCTCLKGFNGYRCENNIDDCVGVQCPLNKICVDGIASYECQCPPGFTGEDCTSKTDPCLANPCKNDGICSRDPVTFDYSCACQPGYGGRNCEESVGECSGSNGTGNCNNGICVNNQCYCLPGYTGEKCDLDFDECLSMPCQNNAKCINKVNNYECLCTPGYTGKDCSININECDPMPCTEGSTCIDGINAYTCICQPGLTGKNCDFNIDDCVSSPCLHDAQCIDGLNSYTCNCTDTGYSGEHCEINIDDCIGNPCMNGAHCVDAVKNYHCTCHPGYTGKNCDIDINECESSPCKHGGTCLERSNVTLYSPAIIANLNLTVPESFNKVFEYEDAAGYECLCVPGVTGSNCEINVNECESSPCQNGNCIDLIGGYTCECDEGFEGTNCELDINECEKYTPCIHGTCYDGKANYECICDANYGGKNCSVILKGCAENTCKNNGTCIPYLLNEVDHKFNCTCQNGFQGDTCEKKTTMSLTGNSQILVNTSRDEGYDIQFKFKTTLGDGFLALGKGSTYYILELSKGRLNLHSSLLNKWEGVFVGSNMNNSLWQKVFVAINSTHLVLSANEEQTIYPISYIENSNGVSFPTTYIGGVPSNLKKLTHGQPFLGCAQDIVINGEWVLPESQEDENWLSFRDVEVGCQREPQCSPNPCHSGGHCTDMWRDFSCTCERPYLGHTCQYNFTAATFGYENITNSLVTVTVQDFARRAVRSIVDISMFIKTRQSQGQIFYLGSLFGSTTNVNDETYIAAQLENGELLVRIQFNGTPEAYTVGGVKLNNGYNHLIEVIRNVTLVQVKLNGTEYFRKTISSRGMLNAQVLYLGGHQNQQRPVRQALDSPLSTKADVTAATGPAAAPLSMIHFKGIIQDVQISNGSKIMVVEFFPLNVKDLNIPMTFGTVNFDNTTVLEGVLSDDSCKISPCQHNGTCINTWNDYRCECQKGYKGKDCTEQEFCQLKPCPAMSECKNLEDGFECLANISFSGDTSPSIYNYTSTLPVATEIKTLELTYRTRSWGTALFALHQENYFVIFIYHNEVIIQWSIYGNMETKRFKKDHYEGQWATVFFKIKDTVMKGGFKDLVNDDTPNFVVNDLDTVNFTEIFTKGIVYIGGSDNKTFNYFDVIENYDTNTSSLIFDQTTENGINSNSIENEVSSENYPIFRADLNKMDDRFKGCLGEIRIDRHLVSYFPIADVYKTLPNEYFNLLPGEPHNLGCILCYNKDCFNGGQCSKPEKTYKCSCPQGFEADDCSIDINECEFNECKNNATCLDKIGKYECECLLGYQGEYCEDEIDECASNPCHNGGTCIDQLGSFKCECLEEYVGKQCEAVRLITCENEPCKEGSTCENGRNMETGNNFTCICKEGMVGAICDTAFCLMNKCQNGQCNTTASVPFCQCQIGYEGEFCEINIDDCKTASGGNPCQNGGQCIDGINRYSCNCTGTGYNGQICEFDIDECLTERNLCGRGHCRNIPGNYKCVCDEDNKCGQNCSFDDPCKVANPCIHGTCESNCITTADYICKCEDHYTGKNCDVNEMAASQDSGGVNILYIVVPVVIIILLGVAIGLAVLVNVARSKRATRGTYSPSAQEFCNPRVELDHVLKPPPEERLI